MKSPALQQGKSNSLLSRCPVSGMLRGPFTELSGVLGREALVACEMLGAAAWPEAQVGAADQKATDKHSQRKAVDVDGSAGGAVLRSHQ